MNKIYYGNARENLRKRFSPKLILLQEKLNRKAKLEPNFRFYTLYAHLYRKDVLQAAWLTVKRNGGCPGVDGIHLADVEDMEGGVSKYLEEIGEELRTKRYKPQAVLRVYIPKGNSQEKRPLGIPTVKDRIVQAAALLMMEPIFEADFKDCSYGFRPNKSAHDAIKDVTNTLKKGYHTVYDLDFKSYFDSIPHDKLLACLRKRISDRHLLKLIKMMLEAPVEEHEDGKTKINRNSAGTPQGGVISPLLANIYLHWFDEVMARRNWKTFGPPAVLVRYADDLVILVKRYGKDLHDYIQKVIDWMGLEVNRDKSRIVLDMQHSKKKFVFLGYEFGYRQSKYNKDKCYLHLAPSPNALKRAKQRIGEIFDKKYNNMPVKKTISRLNKFTMGWQSYFSLGYPSQVYAKLNAHIEYKLYKHFKGRSQRAMQMPSGQSWYKTFQDLGGIFLKWSSVKVNA